MIVTKKIRDLHVGEPLIWYILDKTELFNRIDIRIMEKICERRKTDHRRAPRGAGHRS